MSDLPQTIDTVEQLEEVLSRPTAALVGLMRRLEGDVMILGAGGKVGPTVAAMARRAVREAGVSKEVFAVARSPLHGLDAVGVTAIECDLLDLDAVARLPRAANILFLAGRKFGSTGQECATWAANVIAPYHVARTFTRSRIVVFSTGCVYPLMQGASGGATEQTPTAPIGEYAMSCLGRERMFDYYSQQAGLKALQFRLNYAVELRYGLLVDIARKVWTRQPVDLTAGYANVIWQGDACNQALLALELCTSPPKVLNVTGPETITVRQIAQRFGELLGKQVAFVGEENGLCYLSDATEALSRFGRPIVTLDTMVRWIAHWLEIGGELWDKPTHFETQDGRF